MSDITNTETPVSEKPVKENDDVQFPPFPEPEDSDFDDDIIEEERNYYKKKFKDLNNVTSLRLHCTACDKHLGCSARSELRMRSHPMLRTLVCYTCHTFYNSGEFEKGDDGSELYCRWCGQGGQVYCCSDCPHVFCAKCIKRNLGAPKIKEIEEADDWKCFKCNNKCLWDLRATCWAVLRYCDQKSKITHKTQDPILKEAYQKHCAQDLTECCKNKFRRKEIKKKEPEICTRKLLTESVISKIPPTIQVKKFASINMEESPKQEVKKTQKRPASPKNKPIAFIKNSITVSSGKSVNHIGIPTLPKKIRMPNSPVINPIRFNNERKNQQSFTYARIRSKPMASPMPMVFNGYNNAAAYSNDNINLSLDSLTQGLDMSTVSGIAGSSIDDDVVCTPDFPLEPLCEVTEDNGDDDVQCMTPGPVAAPKAPAPYAAVRAAALPDLSADNIVQMTENDVTVNASTGGLKFRVDPQTLSSNKMYRLPDGRIFAINANPNMPGGYSATIVAVTDNGAAKPAARGTTFAAKLSAVAQAQAPAAARPGAQRRARRGPRLAKRGARVCDLHVPVEWYRYNLIDAIDAMEYSLSRLHQLKKDATTVHLRTRSLGEMRNLHRALERALNTSVCRFKEIRENINKEFKQYVAKKTSGGCTDDDDDVEILHEDDNDDPIFIDENSTESNVNDGQEVDLTAMGSSDHNESSERDKNDCSRSEADLSTEAESFLKRSSDISNHERQHETKEDNSESESGSMPAAVNRDSANQVLATTKGETKQNGVNEHSLKIGNANDISLPVDTNVKIVTNDKLHEDDVDEDAPESNNKVVSEIDEEILENLSKNDDMGNRMET